MALFSERPTEKLFGGGDTATRALSSTAVENAFVERVYEKLAGVYDLTFGPTLHPGRLQAHRADGDRADGKSVLEVGVGTGINLGLYPRACADHRHRPVGRDAREGARAHRQQGPAQLPRDGDGRRGAELRGRPFDIVYAPYLISVVPDPVQVAREMRRVCQPRRPHRHPQPLQERQPGAVADRDGDLADDRAHRLQERPRPARVPGPGRLTPISIQKVNLPPMWTLVTCVKDHE